MAHGWFAYTDDIPYIIMYGVKIVLRCEEACFDHLNYDAEFLLHPLQIVGENGTHIFVTLQILTIPPMARYNNPRTPDEIYWDILNGTSDDGELPFTIELPSGESVRPRLLRVDPDCPVPSTTTTTVTITNPLPTTSPTGIYSHPL